MKGVFLVFVASIVALATGQDCPAYYVRSQSGQSCYRYFNIRLPYRWASEFCEMVTPCGNGPAKMGSLASVGSPQENMEIYQLVASFSQDNQMEREVWLGWNSMNPHMWEDGTPAYPHGFGAFVSGGVTGGNGWPVDPRNPFGVAPGFAPIMRREFDTIPGRRLPNGRFIPPSNGPVWYLSELTGHTHAFVCEVPIGQTITGPNQPGNNPNQPGFGGPNRPGNNPNQPGFGGPNQPGFGGPNQPGFGGPNQPGFGGPNQPGFGGPNQPNQPPFQGPNQPPNRGPNQPNQPNQPPNRGPNQPNQPPNRGPNQPNQPPNRGPNQPNQPPNRGPNQPRLYQ